MDEDYMCPNCTTPWKCNGPHIPQSVGYDEFIRNNPDMETLYVAIVFAPKDFTLKYNLEYRELLAQNAYDAVLDQLDDRYPDPFEDMRDN